MFSVFFFDEESEEWFEKCIASSEHEARKFVAQAGLTLYKIYQGEKIVAMKVK